MAKLEDIIARAQAARLIPVMADTLAEQRMTSILLATMTVVRPYAQEVLRRVGVQLAKTARLNCYTEVEFNEPGGNGGSRCDGLLDIITRGKRWTAIIESKVERQPIDADQIEKYAEVARNHGIDCILTISNQMVALPTHIPYTMSRRSSAKVTLLHASWSSLLTNAQLILAAEDNMDVEQRFILQEMVRYLDHPKSGVRHFTEMNSEWRTLVNGIRQENHYKRGAPEIEGTVASWHQEERDMCLRLSRVIGHRVNLKLPRKHRQDRSVRVKATADLLASEHKLRSTFLVPNAAGDITVTADLQRRTLTAAIRVLAPGDRKTARARINWLLRQLRNSQTTEAAQDVVVRATYPGSGKPRQATLSEVELDTRCIEPDQRGKLPTGFEVAMIRELGGKFAGRRTFIESLERLVPDFYKAVCQHLRAWDPPPPAMDEPSSPSEPYRDPDRPVMPPAQQPPPVQQPPPDSQPSDRTVCDRSFGDDANQGD